MQINISIVLAPLIPHRASATGWPGHVRTSGAPSTQAGTSLRVQIDSATSTTTDTPRSNNSQVMGDDAGGDANRMDTDSTNIFTEDSKTDA
jgi:hypothetical protein